MEPKPKHRWEVVLWLQQHGEEMSKLLAERDPSLASGEFLWYHTEVEYKFWHGRTLIEGKKKLFVADVPIVQPDSRWVTDNNGHVIIGYKRKPTPGSSTTEEEMIGLDQPRTRRDKPMSVETIRLWVDDDGQIYF